METKLILTFSAASILLFFFIIQPLLCEAHDHNQFNGGKPKNYEFFKHLKGCHKGDNVSGLNDLKKYLRRFGYLNDYRDDNDFDDVLESAIKTYQLNYHLNVTGSLDSETITQMEKPRCGVPDIRNGKTSMESGKMKHDHRLTEIHTVSHYSFFPGSPKWPSSKTHLTYAFRRGIRRDIMSPICTRAFRRWSEVTDFTFQEITSFLEADIKISFYRGDHGDGRSFDGPGGILALAYAPTDGRLHFDADTQWSVGPSPSAFDLETVAVHEIGHLLGLFHSSVEDSVMYPSVTAGTQNVNLHADDITGVRALYNL